MRIKLNYYIPQILHTVQKWHDLNTLYSIFTEKNSFTLCSSNNWCQSVWLWVWAAKLKKLSSISDRSGKASKLAIDPTQPHPNKYWRQSRQLVNPTSHFQILPRLRRLEIDLWHSSTKEIWNILMKPKPVMEYNNMNAVHHQHWQLASAPVIRHNTKKTGNACINITVGPVRITTVAVEKQ